MKYQILIVAFCSLISFNSKGQNRTIQIRLDKGETPFGIYKKNPSLLDSLYLKRYAGGIIFYLDTQSGSGFVAAPYDINANGATWGCNEDGMSDNSTDFGSGEQNTMGIVNQCTSKNTAAYMCSTQVINQFNDWFLPSRDELIFMMKKIGKDKSFGDYQYWSSSQWGQWGGMQNFAYVVFRNQHTDKYTKTSDFSFRPVRKFKEPTLPQVGISGFGGITSSSVSVFGTIISDGGGKIISKGICYSTSENPDTSIHVQYDTSSSNNIYVSINGLTINTTYYVKSFAVNGKGIEYSDQMTFTTRIDVGDRYLGGTVVYILQSGDTGYSATKTHGIIADTVDYSVMWYPNTTTNWCVNQPTPNDTSIGWGKINTAALLLQNCHMLDTCSSCAIHLCYGYWNSDWYIPSKQELNKMRPLKNLLNMNYREGGNENGSMYWSSSIADWGNKTAWAQSYYNNLTPAENPGYQEPYDMGHWWPVRRVKYF